MVRKDLKRWFFGGLLASGLCQAASPKKCHPYETRFVFQLKDSKAFCNDPTSSLQLETNLWTIDLGKGTPSTGGPKLYATDYKEAIITPKPGVSLEGVKRKMKWACKWHEGVYVEYE